MKKIYLMRHGQSEGNELGIVQGTNDSVLSNQGIEEAKAASELIRNFKIDKIYTSELSRAKQTAEIIGKNNDIEVEVVREFIELDFGNWQGKKFEDIKKVYKDDFLIWKKNPDKAHIDGFEGIENGKKRMLEGFNKIEKDNLENILIVSHGSALKCLIIGLLGMDNSFYKNMVMSNTGISLIEKGDYNIIMRFYNNFFHLEKIGK